MAWIFSLSAECGPSPEDARAFAAYFDQRILTTAYATHALHASPLQDTEQNWWVTVGMDGVSDNGGSNQADIDRMTAVGWQLYDLLRAAPSYRYACVGVEVFEFRTWSEIDQDLIDLDFHGAVINTEVWERLGAPAIFVAFAPGYYWRPYQGETL